MIRIINIITLGCLLLIISCGRQNTKSSIEKATINFDEVARVEIKNSPLGHSNEIIEIKVLTNEQVKSLVEKWNNSKSKGPCKFGVQYWIYVSMTDGTKRTFRTNGENIKEKDDRCFDIGEDKFFKNIFVNATAFDTSDQDSGQTTVTIIKHDNQNSGFKYLTDTVLNAKIIDLKKEKVDVYFCYSNFHIPYYMPTNNIYRDEIKDKECNWKIYPSTVKCYEYDKKNRVVKMQVEGSGTTGSHTFIYDNNDKIIEMQSHGSIYKMTYNKNGNLTKMTVDGGELKKQLEFIYGLQ